MPSRRTFIHNCSALAVSAVVMPVSAMAVPRARRQLLLAQVSAGTFNPFVNAVFAVHDTEGRTQSLRLIQVARPASEAQSAGDSFALLFQGRVSRPLTQDTYSFEHTRLGRLEMFIVPVGRNDQRHSYYEAVFNRPPAELLPEPQLVAPSGTR